MSRILCPATLGRRLENQGLKKNKGCTSGYYGLLESPVLAATVLIVHNQVCILLKIPSK